MTDTSEGSLAFVKETTFGITPATPAFKGLRITSESLTGQFETLVSNEVRSDAEVSEVRRSGVTASGDVNFELHRAAALEDLLAAGFRGAWDADSLLARTMKESFTFQRKIEAGATDYFLRFVGSRIGGLSLNIVPEDFITGTLRVMSVGHTASAVDITGATYPAPAGVNGSPLVGIDVSAIGVGGIPGVDFLGLTVDIENSLRVQRKIGSVAARGLGYGRRAVTGTVRAYFENIDFYNRLLDDETDGISATVSDGDNGFSLAIPRVRWTAGEVPNPGNDQDFTVSVNYQATYDPGIGASIRLNRV